MSNTVIDKIYKNKIIAVTRGIGIDKIYDTVGALLKGGISLFEIPFNQKEPEKSKDTLKCIELIKKEYGDKVCVGPGTTLKLSQAVDAIDAGADFIIAPTVDTEIIRKTKELGKVSIPGAYTPSEIVTAYNAGADFIKLFPGNTMGFDYLKTIMAPINHIPFIVFGGINKDNVSQYIKAGVVGFGVGGSLIDLKAIEDREFDKLTRLAQDFVGKLEG